MGTGAADGDDRAAEAAQTAISSPLLEDNSIDGATAVLINITAGTDIGIQEIQHASSIIRSAVHEDAEIIFGWVDDDDVGDELMVTVIATGFGREPGQKARDLGLVLRGDKTKDTEIPAYMRKNETETTSDKVRRPSVTLIEEEEFEVPAFLRRQAD
jgi:cell division protein FtsZ